jgi:hypothetical protein
LWFKAVERQNKLEGHGHDIPPPFSGQQRAAVGWVRR